MALSPLLRPPQLPLARRCLAELAAAVTISELVRRLAVAAAELLGGTEGGVRVALAPRVALLREDGSAAVLFSVGDGGLGGGGTATATGGTSVCRRRSTEVVMVEAAGGGQVPAAAGPGLGPGIAGGLASTLPSGVGNRSPDAYFMSGAGSQGGPGTGTGRAPHHHAHAPSLGAAGAAAAGGGGPPSVAGPGAAALSGGCRGQSLSLVGTLLAEALARGPGSGLCIADCNAYVQDSKAFPRDLMLLSAAGGGSVASAGPPPQSLALATGCRADGRPLLALYATYGSNLPQALLQTVVQELGQLLRAVTPAAAAALAPGGAMADEWRYLHDELLAAGPAGSAPTGVSRSAPQLNMAPAAAAASTAPAAPVVTAQQQQQHQQRISEAAGGGDRASWPNTTDTALTEPSTAAVTPTAAAAAAAAAECGSVNATAGTSPATGRAAGVLAAVGSIFRRNGSTGAAAAVPAVPTGAAAVAAARGSGGGGALSSTADDELVRAMNAAAAAISGGADDECDRARLAAFVTGGGSGGGGGGAATGAVGSGAGGAGTTSGAAAGVAGSSARSLCAVGAAAITSGGAASAVATGGACGTAASSAMATGRTSFSLEVAGSPRAALRLAPLITTLHERLKTAQAEQLTSSSRAASRLLDLESLRFLERVGKGGYGSVYRGLYHGAEVAVKVIEDPAASSLSATAKQAAAAAAAAAAPTRLRAKHLHDAIELVASVSFNHPNIVQLITYFVDVRAHIAPDGDDDGAAAGAAANARAPDGTNRTATAAAAAAQVLDYVDDCVNLDLESEQADHVYLDDGDEQEDLEDLVGEYEDDAPPLPRPPVQLVHMESGGEGLGGGGGGDGGARGEGPRGGGGAGADAGQQGGNEAIVLVMEFCDRGSLKEAITEGAFLLWAGDPAAAAAGLGSAGSRQHSPAAGGGAPHLAALQLSQFASSSGGLAGTAGGGGGTRGGPYSLVPFNMKAVYSTLLEIALALRHMHGLHMVHCDLKPQNVLLKSNPRDPRGVTAKLSDFGLAKMMAHDDNGELVIDESIQSGTITHLPPEVLLGKRPLGPAVDVYSFGIVMWQMLCGMALYGGLDVRGLIRGVVRHALRPSFPAWVPPEYRLLAQRCWDTDPAGRPTSLQLVAELESLLAAAAGPGGGLPRRSGDYSPRSGFMLGPGGAGSMHSVRSRGPSLAGGAAGAAGGPRRKPPHKCATDTAINGGGQGGRLGGGAGGGRARAPPPRHYSYYTYAPPTTGLYQAAAPPPHVLAAAGGGAGMPVRLLQGPQAAPGGGAAGSMTKSYPTAAGGGPVGPGGRSLMRSVPPAPAPGAAVAAAMQPAAAATASAAGAPYQPATLFGGLMLPLPLAAGGSPAAAAATVSVAAEASLYSRLGPHGMPGVHHHPQYPQHPYPSLPARPPQLQQASPMAVAAAAATAAANPAYGAGAGIGSG
ncbi:hypothetical protein HXX76_014768 [Chlamydomonas incerta]|uniref:Protein kinase domain-containing protein n=1 Tax=Chlamydomonas incerta TaxID=51695 RepID=A0A835VSE1_CHLIN|nr:hypothetical protein HXX76_014768 [Chlamydomonas incerta]|eukprot:KAG2424093.1 hypothetical protein HXX76_014768 [Chlamydomonas incerta]